ncbi:MAG: ABC transporter permease [Anaerolineae bacterium]|nr:ABC transporter permease [Anaerolineae bacterium]
MKYLFTRLLWLPVVMWAVATLTFITLRIVPGNYIESVANQILDPEQIARVQAIWGLDRPITEQYAAFMSDLVRGDLGLSMSSGIPLSRLIFERMPPTIELALVAMVISTGIGMAVGIVSAVTHNRLVDYATRTFAVLWLSLPLFWVAMMLIVIFAVQLRWMPASGRIDARLDYEVITNFMLIDHVLTGNRAALSSFVHHLILPALAIGLTSSGFVARLTRSAMLEIVHSDYVRTARAKGLSERRVILKHALQNALLPIITLQGLQFGTLLGGAVITEIVFTRPGMGRMLLDGILKRDFPVVQGAVMIVAFVYVVINMLVDIIYHVVDPRLRHS